MCGQLIKAMYGTRPAAQQWQNKYTSDLLAMGLTRGKSSPCVFRHHLRDLNTFVHGDDFVTSGSEDNLAWMQESLENIYKIKTQVLGEQKRRRDNGKKCGF